MLRRIAKMAAVVALAAAALATPTATQATAPQWTILDRQASRATVPVPIKAIYGSDDPQPDTEIEPSIGVNPANPLNAVAAFQVDRIDNGGDADNGYATTFDGGKTWTHGYLPGLTTRVTKDPAAFERASDAVVAFGPHNVVYANSLVFDLDTNQGLPSGMAVNVSKDGGRTWSAPVFLEQDNIGGTNDKNWLVVDNGTGAGHHPGRVYLVWDRVAPMVYAYCDPDAGTPAGCDHLANWSNAPENNGAFYVFGTGPGIGAVPFVEPDGSLGVMYESDFAGTPSIGNPPTDQPDFGIGAQIMLTEAKAAGSVPFPAPLTFAQVPVGVAYNDSTCCASQRAGTLPSADVDPKSGQIYVVWEDARLRSDGLNDIVFSTSTDGVTWTPAARINSGPENDYVNRYNPSVSIGPGGTVEVAYRQRAEPKSGLSNTIDTYWQRSNDQGRTWSPPVKVNSVETDARYGAFSRAGLFQGDYDQIAAASNSLVYIVRDESYPIHPNEPCNCSFTQGNGHQHQYTWVAVVNPPPPESQPSVLGANASTPLTRAGAALSPVLPLLIAVFGLSLLGSGLWLIRRRRP